MALLACHVQKFADGDLRGIQIHNDRESSNSKNKDIDYSRTNANFDALTGVSGNPHTNYRTEVEKRLQSGYRGKKAIRKDAVKLVSVLVSAETAFFKKMGDADIKKFFKTAADYLADHYGKENVVAAKVHMDETTPHMHFTFVPLRDGRLTAKTIINRKDLKQIQDELPMVLQKAGYNIQRGMENSSRKHLDVSEFKRKKEMENIPIQQVEKIIKHMQKNSSMTKSGFMGISGKNMVKIPLNDYKLVTTIMHDYMVIRSENNAMRTELKKLEAYKSECNRLRHNTADAELLRELKKLFPQKTQELKELLIEQKQLEERMKILQENKKIVEEKVSEEELKPKKKIKRVVVRHQSSQGKNKDRGR